MPMFTHLQQRALLTLARGAISAAVLRSRVTATPPEDEIGRAHV